MKIAVILFWKDKQRSKMLLHELKKEYGYLYLYKIYKTKLIPLCIFKL
jgi:hypothetical protein